jgi:hypothetical protein
VSWLTASGEGEGEGEEAGEEGEGEGGGCAMCQVRGRSTLPLARIHICGTGGEASPMLAALSPSSEASSTPGASFDTVGTAPLHVVRHVNTTHMTH